MKRVIIYGVSPKCCKLRRYIENFLNDEYEILGYSDGHYTNDPLDHKPFFKPEEICKQQVDFVLLSVKAGGTQKNIQRYLTALDVPPEKIIRPSLLFEQDEQHETMLVDLIKSIREEYKQENGLIFGLSYSEIGIIEEKLNIPFYNCSWPSFDLYCNFCICDYMFTHGLVSKVDTALWIFPYYYFDYNLFLTSRMYQFSSLWRLNDWSHSTDSPAAYEMMENLKMFSQKWMKFWGIQKFRVKSSSIYGEADGTALLDPIWFSNHEATVSENKRIFVKFFNELTEKGGKVILVIPPFYLNGLNKASQAAFQSKKERFYKILHELETEIGKIPVFDYADRFMKKRNNFRDLTHLNFAGAEEFTDIINNEVIQRFL